jgi:hypothetical protein
MAKPLVIENIKKNTKSDVTTYIDNIINLKHRHEAFNNQQTKYHTNCNRNLIVNFYFHFIFFSNKVPDRFKKLFAVSIFL